MIISIQNNRFHFDIFIYISLYSNKKIYFLKREKKPEVDSSKKMWLNIRNIKFMPLSNLAFLY